MSRGTLADMPAAKEAHVVTVSDRCASGLRADASGPAARAALEASGWAVTSSLVPDGEASVADAVRAAVAAGARFVVTSGGTGVGPAGVVGIPVGVVGGGESKGGLAENPFGLEFLTVLEGRGGSAIAVAAVNAIASTAETTNEARTDA